MRFVLGVRNIELTPTRKILQSPNALDRLHYRLVCQCRVGRHRWSIEMVGLRFPSSGGLWYLSNGRRLTPFTPTSGSLEKNPFNTNPSIGEADATDAPA